MKPLYYILFFVIFSSRYFFVVCQNVPSPRCQQTSTLVGTRFYFFGGVTSLNTYNEVWYLDLSNSFNISTPPWHSDVAMPVAYNLGSSCLNPIDSSTVFLIGGRTRIATSATTDDYSVYKFDSKTSQWTTPAINNFNSNFTSRNTIQAVVDNNGKIFIFGGSDFISLTMTPTSNFYNDMNILDITTMIWSTLTQSQSILTYVDYTATLLPNGLIAYIGGRSGSSTSFASGSTIASRVAHSAVLTQDGNIIIYGGETLNGSGYAAYVFSDIAVLNTNSWVWFVPSVSGTRAPPLADHSAALYNNYMILAFGETSSTLYTNNIYILDIQNYTWVTTFNIPTTTNPAKQTQSNGNSSTDQANNNSSTLNFGIGIGVGVVLAAFLFVIGFFIYKNRHKQEIIATPGTPNT
ncbi:galactose oxidase [Gigaspora margarita]|uniref:Galactose oxidase n=1 Tax=Gigaspora margarita TaxID=4874 RepID=A0A8H4ET06_GIGMA|nr:galactose oxidase [Gigaspora margarita]